MSNYFEGFPKEYIDFLWELKMNNNTEWFNLNRERYEHLIKEPMKLFSAEMTERLNNMDMGVSFRPAISRANRDIRFAKDKSPYKDRKWVVFNYGEGRWQEKCCLFFEITPQGYTCGMGIYNAYSEYLTRYRKKITADSQGLKRLDKKLKDQNRFVLDTRLYKKNFIPEGADKEIAHWYQHKDIGFITETKISEELFTRKILDVIENDYKFLKPFFNYFKDI